MNLGTILRSEDRIIGDGAYKFLTPFNEKIISPLLKNLPRRYKRRRDIPREVYRAMVLRDHIMSKSRCIIENAFKQMKVLWKSTVMYTLHRDKATIHILNACCLTNLYLRTNRPVHDELSIHCLLRELLVELRMPSLRSHVYRKPHDTSSEDESSSGKESTPSIESESSTTSSSESESEIQIIEDGPVPFYFDSLPPVDCSMFGDSETSSDERDHPFFHPLPDMPTVATTSVESMSESVEQENESVEPSIHESSHSSSVIFVGIRMAPPDVIPIDSGSESEMVLDQQPMDVDSSSESGTEHDTSVFSFLEDSEWTAPSATDRDSSYHPDSESIQAAQIQYPRDPNLISTDEDLL